MKKDYTIQTKITKRELEDVKEIAQQKDRTVSNLVRTFILKEIYENGERKN